MNLVQVIIDDSTDKIIVGTHAYDRSNGGIFIGGAGTVFPASPSAGEWFWRSDENKLYRRNDTNTAWNSAVSDVDAHALGGTAHTPSTLAAVNSKISDATLDDSSASRPPLQHNIAGAAHTGQLSHTSLTNIGFNTHVQIDNHISDDTGNPHAVVEPQCWKYQPSTTDPTSPAPVDGDRYYNTAIEKWMFYSGSRSKWLSTETAIFQFGRNGNTAPGSYYKGINGMTLTSMRGWPAIHNGTVVAFGYTRSDNDYARFEICGNGTTLSWEDSTDTEGVVSDLNDDFDQDDVLSVRNRSGGHTTSNVQGWVVVRWRA